MFRAPFGNRFSSRVPVPIRPLVLLAREVEVVDWVLRLIVHVILLTDCVISFSQKYVVR